MQHKIDDPAKIRALGLIDLPTIQRYLNFHFSVTMDLFGADVSSNAATFYSTGLEGPLRGDEDRTTTTCSPAPRTRCSKCATAASPRPQAPALNALNEKLRDDYVKDAQAGIERWNKIIEKSGVAFRLRAPHKAFNRKIGPLVAVRVDPEGNVVSEADWTHRHARTGCRPPKIGRSSRR